MATHDSPAATPSHSASSNTCSCKQPSFTEGPGRARTVFVVYSLRPLPQRLGHLLIAQAQGALRGWGVGMRGSGRGGWGEHEGFRGIDTSARLPSLLVAVTAVPPPLPSSRQAACHAVVVPAALKHGGELRHSVNIYLQSTLRRTLSATMSATASTSNLRSRSMYQRYLRNTSTGVNPLARCSRCYGAS